MSQRYEYKEVGVAVRIIPHSDIPRMGLDGQPVRGIGNLESLHPLFELGWEVWDRRLVVVGAQEPRPRRYWSILLRREVADKKPEIKITKFDMK